MSPALPERMEYRYSIPYSVAVLAASLLVAGTSGVALVALALTPGWAVIGWTGLAVVVPPLLWLFLHGLRGLREREPVFILDEVGATDARQRESSVAWDAVSEINLGWHGNTLTFDFRSPALAREVNGAGYGVRKVVRTLMFLGDWNVGTLALAGSRSEMLRAARAYQQQAVRRRTAELNRRRPAA